MRSVTLKIIASTASLLFLCGCNDIIVASLQHDMATSKFMPQTHSAPPDVSLYAANAGSDPLKTFLFSALKDYPNGFSNLASRPMTEQEKMQDEEAWEKRNEDILDSVAKTNPSLDRAAILRTLPKNPNDKRVLLNPPPGSRQSVCYSLEKLLGGIQVLTEKSKPQRFVTYSVDLVFDGGSSPEEAKAKARLVFDTIRNLLGNDSNWTYRDDVWMNGFTQAHNSTMAGKHVPVAAPPVRDTVGWMIDYSWKSQAVTSNADTVIFGIGTRKPSDSSRYELCVALSAIVHKQWDK